MIEMEAYNESCGGEDCCELVRIMGGHRHLLVPLLSTPTIISI
jgi:hypothetical protein